MDFDWLFKLVGGCQARDRHDCPERERGPWANEPVQSHLAHMPREHSGIVDVVHHGGNRDSLDAVSVRSGASKASAGREDHFFEARRDLKKHVRVLESEKDKLQDLGQDMKQNRKKYGTGTKVEDSIREKIRGVRERVVKLEKKRAELLLILEMHAETRTHTSVFRGNGIKKSSMKNLYLDCEDPGSNAGSTSTTPAARSDSFTTRSRPGSMSSRPGSAGGMRSSSSISSESSRTPSISSSTAPPSRSALADFADGIWSSGTGPVQPEKTVKRSKSINKGPGASSLPPDGHGDWYVPADKWL